MPSVGISTKNPSLQLSVHFSENILDIQTPVVKNSQAITAKSSLQFFD